jgi:AcrR family transcriptional regulator
VIHTAEAMAEAREPSRRMSADERRELLLAAARTEFALHGLYGASTKTIASAAGISQPYLFQLVDSKKELFLAVLDRSFERTMEALREAAKGVPREEVFAAIGQAYMRQLAEDREGLMALVQFLAACTDDEVRLRVRERYGELYQYVERVSGANDEAVRTLFAYGMLGTSAAAMRLPEIATGDSWARRLLGFLEEIDRA